MNDDRLMQEFMQAPQGQVREGSLVVRPSLRAALERFLLALAGVSIVFLPAMLGTFVSRDARGLGALTVLDIFFSILLPLAVSFVPALQLAFTRYVLDDEGIRERVQILSKTEKRVKWEKVTALQHRRTLLDRVLGIERVDVIAYGARGATVHMVGLLDAAHLRDLVAKQMRRQASARRLFSND